MQIKNLECEYTACYNKTMPKTEADSIPAYMHQNWENNQGKRRRILCQNEQILTKY